MVARERARYQGAQRKLVLAFDIGTTFSGASYCILDPGEVPKTYGVTRYPAQENVGSESKIPTVLYYDSTGTVRAAGAEAMDENMVEEAEDNNWTKVEWFKLRLRPKHLSAAHINDSALPPLPIGKSAVSVFGDFLRYLFHCARDYIHESHANGDLLWRSVEGHMDFVLSHPNGWEGAQQSQMRRAAVAAGLIPDTPEGHSHIQFVTEGEASLHFCVNSSLSSEAITNGQGVIVVDAGGGTIDLSAYHMKTPPNHFEEIAPPECRLQGSIFVSRRARKHFEDKLHGSRFGSPEDIATMTSTFDKTTKTRFRDSKETCFIRFGSARDNDPRLGIRSGQLRLPGTEVAGLFEPAIQATIDAVQQQISSADKPITAIFLVGGFAASDWLFSRLQSSFQSQTVAFCRPDQHVNKAVADGAISFYLDRFVSTRVARWTYGVESSVAYDANNFQHQRRANTVTTWSSGEAYVPKNFSVILRKGTQTEEAKEFQKPFFREFQAANELQSFSVEISCYRGDTTPVPQWTDLEPDEFKLLCRVEADTRQMSRSLKMMRSSKGNRYHRIDFRIVLLFGLTELKAQVAWMVNGNEMRGPATIIYDENT